MATATQPETTTITAAPPIFATWEVKDALAAIEAVIDATVGSDGYAANSAFIEEGDHWQDGDRWVGPDGGGSLELRTKVLEAVARQFTPVDAVGEALDNVVNGLLRREPDVTFTPRKPGGKDGAPSDAQEQAIAAMREHVSGWWDSRKLFELAKTAVRRARWSTRGLLRAWLTPATLVERATEDGVVRELPGGLPFADALALVQVSAPAPDVAIVYTDSETQDRCAIFVTSEQGAGGTEVTVVELWYRAGEETVVRVVRSDDTEPEEHRLPIGGRLPIVQMEADLLLTESVRKQQDRLNFFETLLVRVGETAGFPERYTTNAMPHGLWLTSPPADGPPLETQEVDGTTWYLHRAPRAIGAALTTDLRGIEVEDANGKKTLTTPGITFKEPTDPEYCVKASEHARATILRSCKQGHLANTSQAETSGDAYEQARTAHEADLDNTRGPLEAMLRELIEVAIAMAGAMSADARGEGEVGRGFLDEYRCVVTCHVSAGPVSAEKQTAIMEQADKGFVSRPTTMMRLGVEDVAAELVAIEADPIYQAKKLKAQAEAVAAWVDAGAALDVAAEVCGIPADLARKLMGDVTDRGVEQ